MGMHINASLTSVAARQCCTAVHPSIASHCTMFVKSYAKRAKPTQSTLV